MRNLTATTTVAKEKKTDFIITLVATAPDKGIIVALEINWCW